MLTRLTSAILLSGIAAIFAFGARASDKQPLLELTNSMNREMHYLSAFYERPSVTPKGLNITVMDEAGQLKESINFSIAQIASSEGAVLARSAGRAAVILRGQLDAKTGGTVTLKYLTNILIGSYSECLAHVRKAGSLWQIVNAYTGAVITRAHIQTWTLGISALQGVCPESEKTETWETDPLE